MPMESSTIDNQSNVSYDARYVEQLEKRVKEQEKRVKEQEQLIALLNEKIIALDSGSKRGGRDVRTPCSSDAGVSGVLSPPVSSLTQSFVGSRKTNLASVATAKDCQLFVSRLNPSVTAADLARNLMDEVAEVQSVKCCRMKTKYSKYASFHIVVPEAQKQFVLTESAWPEGVFVKIFAGKLLDNYILESFDSETNETTVPPSSPQVRKTSKSTAATVTVPTSKKAVGTKPTSSSSIVTKKPSAATSRDTGAPAQTKRLSNQRDSLSSSSSSPKNHQRVTRSNPPR